MERPCRGVGRRPGWTAAGAPTFQATYAVGQVHGQQSTPNPLLCIKSAQCPGNATLLVAGG
jgi:hypothetical protein